MGRKKQKHLKLVVDNGRCEDIDLAASRRDDRDLLAIAFAALGLLLAAPFLAALLALRFVSFE